MVSRHVVHTDNTDLHIPATRSGDKETKEPRRTAAAHVPYTGGVYKGFNGGDVVMPFGMDKSTFKDRYTASAQQALKDAGLNVNAASNFTPVNIGNNQYRLVSGSGRWATDAKTNEAIVVRVE